MKRPILTLLALTGVAVLSLLLLDRLKGNTNLVKNGFSRTFTGSKFTKAGEFKLDKTFYRICGQDGSKVFLSTLKPGEILILDTENQETGVIKIKIPPVNNLEPSFSTTVIYPYVFITGSNNKKLIRGNLLNDSTEVFDLHAPGPILNAAITGNGTGIFRCIDTVTHEAKFRAIDFIKKEIKEENDISRPLKDYGFTYSGNLLYDEATGRMVYLSFYSNELLSFDRSLDSVLKGHTIDTTYTPRINTTGMNSSYTHATPPTTINKISCVSSGALYINSRLMADNEEHAAYNNNAVVDRYDAVKNKYTGSFYLPEAELKDFSVLKNNNVAVLLSDRLIVYRPVNI